MCSRIWGTLMLEMGSEVSRAQGLAKVIQLVQSSSGAELGVLAEPPKIMQAAPRWSPALARPPHMGLHAPGLVRMLASQWQQRGLGFCSSMTRFRLLVTAGTALKFPLTQCFQFSTFKSHVLTMQHRAGETRRQRK